MVNDNTTFSLIHSVEEGKWFLTASHIHLIYLTLIKAVKNHLPSSTTEKCASFK